MGCETHRMGEGVTSSLEKQNKERGSATGNAWWETVCPTTADFLEKNNSREALNIY